MQTSKLLPWFLITWMFLAGCSGSKPAATGSPATATLHPTAQESHATETQTAVEAVPTPAPEIAPTQVAGAETATPIANGISLIAYSEGGCLRVMQPDGAQPQKLHCPEDTGGKSADARFVWSWDASQIAYLNGADLLVSDRLSGNSHVLYHGDPQALEFGRLDSGPSWSPDGKSMAIAAARNLLLVDLDTQEITTLTGDVWGNVSASNAASDLAWTPDGRHLLYLRGGSEYQDLQGLAMISIENPEDSRLVIPSVSNFALSPDGQHLLYRLIDEGIWLADARCLEPETAAGCQDGAQRLVSPDSELYAGYDRLVWSPDGKKALTRTVYDTWLLDIAAGNVQKIDLSQPSLYLTNPWSPDSSRLVLAYVSNGGSKSSQLFIYNLDSGQEEPLPGLDKSISHAEASWSPLFADTR